MVIPVSFLPCYRPGVGFKYIGVESKPPSVAFVIDTVIVYCSGERLLAFDLARFDRLLLLGCPFHLLFHKNIGFYRHL